MHFVCLTHHITLHSTNNNNNTGKSFLVCDGIKPPIVASALSCSIYNLQALHTLRLEQTLWANGSSSWNKHSHTSEQPIVSGELLGQKIKLMVKKGAKKQLKGSEETHQPPLSWYTQVALQQKDIFIGSRMHLSTHKWLSQGILILCTGWTIVFVSRTAGAGLSVLKLVGSPPGTPDTVWIRSSW